MKRQRLAAAKAVPLDHPTDPGASDSDDQRRHADDVGAMGSSRRQGSDADDRQQPDGKRASRDARKHALARQGSDVAPRKGSHDRHVEQQAKRRHERGPYANGEPEGHSLDPAKDSEDEERDDCDPHQVNCRRVNGLVEDLARVGIPRVERQ